MDNDNWKNLYAGDLHDIILENMDCLRAGKASEDMLDKYHRIAIKALDLLYKKAQQAQSDDR